MKVSNKLLLSGNIIDYELDFVSFSDKLIVLHTLQGLLDELFPQTKHVTNFFGFSSIFSVMSSIDFIKLNFIPG